MEGLIYSSAKSIAAAIREKKVSCKEALEAHLRRIDEVNPRLNAVVQLARDRAQTEAAEADRALARGEIKGPLHGVADDDKRLSRYGGRNFDGRHPRPRRLRSPGGCDGSGPNARCRRHTDGKDQHP